MTDRSFQGSTMTNALIGAVRITLAGMLRKRGQPAPPNFTELIAFVEIEGGDGLHVFRTPISEVLKEAVEVHRGGDHPHLMADALERLAHDAKLAAEKLRGYR